MISRAKDIFFRRLGRLVREEGGVARKGGGEEEAGKRRGVPGVLPFGNLAVEIHTYIIGM